MELNGGSRHPAGSKPAGPAGHPPPGRRSRPLAPARPAGQNAGMRYLSSATAIVLGLLVAGVGGWWLVVTPRADPPTVSRAAAGLGLLAGLWVTGQGAV